MTTDLKSQAKEATTLVLETTKEYASRLLTDGRFAMQEQRTHQELFQAGRRDQIRLKLRDANVHERMQAVRQGWDADARNAGSMTAAQIEATAEFPIERVKALTGTQINDMKKASDQTPYQRYRLAAATHGVLPKSVLEQVNVADAVPADEPLQQLPAVVAQALGVDPTLRVSSAGLDKALRSYAEITAKQIIERGDQ